MNLKIGIFIILVILIFVSSLFWQKYSKKELNPDELPNNNRQEIGIETEINPDGWPLPDVQKAEAKSKVTKKIGTVEALFESFVTPEKTVFNRISTDGEVWAYLVDTDGKKPMDYILIRSNKLANFDMRIPASQEVPIPDWVQKK